MGSNSKRVVRRGDRTIKGSEPHAQFSSNVNVNRKGVVRERDRTISGNRAHSDHATTVLVNGRRVHGLGDPHDAVGSGDASHDTSFGTILHEALHVLENIPTIKVKCEHSGRVAKVPYGTLEVVPTLGHDSAKSADYYNDGAVISSAPTAPLAAANGTVTPGQGETKSTEPVDVIQLTVSKKLQMPATAPLLYGGPHAQARELKAHGRSYKFEAACDAKDSAPWNRAYWTTGTEYRVSGLAYPLNVIARSPHKWSIKLDTPFISRQEGNRDVKEEAEKVFVNPKTQQSKRVLKNVVATSTWTPWKGNVLKTTETLSATDQRVREDGREKGRAKSKTFEKKQVGPVDPNTSNNGALKISKDDREISISPSAINSIKIYNDAKKLLDSIIAWYQAGMKFVPKWGVYPEFEVGVGRGEVEVAAQWRELPSSSQTWLWVGVCLKAVILELKAELHLGASWLGAELSVYVGIHDECSVSVDFERAMPTMTFTLDLQFELVVEAYVAVLAKAASYYEGKAEAFTGFEIKHTVSIGQLQENKHRSHGELKWREPKGKVVFIRENSIEVTPHEVSLAKYLPFLAERTVAEW